MSQLRKRQGQIDQSMAWLFESFLILLKEFSFSEISVAKIAQKAGVSRQTFYRYCRTKEDLLQWYIRGVFQVYREELLKLETYSLRDDVILYFSICGNQSITLKQLFSSGLEYLVLQKITDYTYEFELQFEYNSDRSRHYVAEYFAAGIFVIMARWIRDDKPETPEQLADLILTRCMDQSLYENCSFE